jgi:hypothetical protein
MVATLPKGTQMPRARKGQGAEPETRLADALLRTVGHGAGQGYSRISECHALGEKARLRISAHRKCAATTVLGLSVTAVTAGLGHLGHACRHAPWTLQLQRSEAPALESTGLGNFCRTRSCASARPLRHGRLAVVQRPRCDISIWRRACSTATCGWTLRQMGRGGCRRKLTGQLGADVGRQALRQAV